MSDNSWQERLRSLSTGERAVMRRCAGKLLQEADASALSIFYRLLPYGTPEWKHNKYFTAMCCACLWKPEQQHDQRPIEDCLKQFALEQSRKEGFYARIRNLLDTYWDDSDGFMAAKLARILKQIKTVSKPIFPDFEKLAEDLCRWNRDDRLVQRRWAEAVFSLNDNTEINDNKEEE